MATLLRKLFANNRGGTAIEYGLIASLVVVAMIASVVQLGNTTTTLWNNVNTKVSNVTPGP